MRLVKFSAQNIENELADMTDKDLDSLAFGAVELDSEGVILRYNAAEAEISNREQEGMVGRNFFDIAPCTRGKAFEGRFREGVESGKLNVQFTYVLDNEMTPTRVQVRMRRAEDKDAYWVLIKRVSPSGGT